MATGSESRFSVAVRELFSFELYKRSQGRRMRLLTAVGIGIFFLWGLKTLSDQLVAAREREWVAYGIPAVLCAIAAWGIFRIVNWPRFADFLIATDAEMGKVSWSTKDELKRATMVVLLALFLLAGFLLVVDMAWSWFLERISVLQTTQSGVEEASLNGPGLPVAWNLLVKIPNAVAWSIVWPAPGGKNPR